jgi:hypothetical protein
VITRYLILYGVVAASIAGLSIRGRIPQDANYHLFADRRTFLRIPNFWNVASNLPFLIVGLAGLRATARSVIDPALTPAYVMFFVALVFLSFGSAYYHLAPDNGRLTWDRLPMAIAFMAFLVIVIGERINPDVARVLLPPLLLTGAASVAWWHVSETRGRGDLRAYLLVQFLPLVLAALITLLFPSSLSETYGTWGMLIAYVLAKIAEIFDEGLFFRGAISGHTVKHLAAAGGVYCLVLAMA